MSSRTGQHELPEVSAGGPDKRKQILRAAVVEFAQRGFHRTRVSDIAKRAGVAYGLVYHYFESKDEVLNHLFAENWAVFLKVLREIRDRPNEGAVEKLDAIAALLIDALRAAPELIQVMVHEVSRSNRFVQPGKVHAFQEAFSVVRVILEEGQRQAQIRPEIDPLIASHLFFGALETVCTGFLLGSIQCEADADAARIKECFALATFGGLAAPLPQGERE